MGTKKEDVARLLKESKQGLTIGEISKELNFSRNTIAVAVAELYGAELIEIRHIGMAKLITWKGGKNE